MTQRGGWKDFSEMSDDALRSLAYDLSHPAEAMKRIRDERRRRPLVSGEEQSR